MKISDAYFLAHGTGDLKDIQMIKWIDAMNNSDADSTTLMTVMDYGTPKAIVPLILSRKLPPAAGSYLKYFAYAQELQAEGLIPREVELDAYLLIASVRKIPPEKALLQLVIRGARAQKSNKSNSNGN